LPKTLAGVISVQLAANDRDIACVKKPLLSRHRWEADIL
jgi:hypothetical protein